MGLHDSFRHLQHKLWQKKRSGIKVGNLIPDHKKLGIDLTSVHASGMRYATEKLSTKIATLFKPHPDRRSKHEVIAAQSFGNSNLGSFETRDKKPFRCEPRGEV
jgi:hypothetical protein